MSAFDLNQDFRDLLLALADAQVEFVLIGGWALAVHGHARGTDDLDVLVRATPENATRVLAALAAFGAPIEAHNVTEELFASEGYGYRMGIKPNLIELLTTISGVSFDEAIAGHHTIVVDSRTIPVMRRDALLANKRAAGRPKDLPDVARPESHPDAS